MQDAFFRAFTHLEGFKEDARFSTWLTRIAINAALMTLRRRRPTVSLDDERESEKDFVVHELEDWGPSPERGARSRSYNTFLARRWGSSVQGCGS
jgi:RNA polymerase sigma-70 factor (ECF subfamily)